MSRGVRPNLEDTTDEDWKRMERLYKSSNTNATGVKIDDFEHLDPFRGDDCS